MIQTRGLCIWQPKKQSFPTAISRNADKVQQNVFNITLVSRRSSDSLVADIGTASALEVSEPCGKSRVDFNRLVYCPGINGKQDLVKADL
jgi:hypothetical protein